MEINEDGKKEKSLEDFRGKTKKKGKKKKTLKDYAM